jgi:hypothetical protein
MLIIRLIITARPILSPTYNVNNHVNNDVNNNVNNNVNNKRKANPLPDLLRIHILERAEWLRREQPLSRACVRVGGDGGEEHGVGDDPFIEQILVRTVA